MSRYEQYMVRRLKEEEQERAGKEAYGNLDVVNNPAHYNQAGVECIEAIAAATDNTNSLFTNHGTHGGLKMNNVEKTGMRL